MKMTFNKIAAFLFLVLPLFMLAGCSKDDESGDDNPTSGEGEIVNEELKPIDEIIEEARQARKIFDFGEDGDNGDVNEAFLSLFEDNLNAIRELAEDDGNNGGESTSKGYELYQATCNYKSTDASGKEIPLSATLYYPRDPNAKGAIPLLQGVIVSMPATRHQSQNPDDNGGMSAMGATGTLALKGYLVIEPNYIGFDVSADRIQTYLCHKLIARNAGEGLPIAITKFQENSKTKGKFVEGYGTYIIGYSQGGGNALALTRYLTVEAPEATKKVVNLKHTFCGGGPYDPFQTFEKWRTEDHMTLSALLPMVLYGHSEGHPEIYGDFPSLQPFFTEDYWNSDVRKNVATRNGGLVDAMKYDPLIADKSIPRGLIGPVVYTSKIASQAALTPGDPHYNALKKSLEAEIIYADWTPKTPILFYHDERDNVVPSLNTDLAYSALHAKAPTLVERIETTEVYGCHIIAQQKYSSLILKEDMFLGKKK